ncbi:hypothetical protein DPMN_023020 [Dreissena polymorpha]|uniref:Peptidase A2 domain-containing protein n=1 Tax=Dreissena polymorpha TaxID=45954 RepID=A0A9D4R9J4_DREPO|nr:hypothetical protein DPMN_023020 [Dreissena polymorpha]
MDGGEVPIEDNGLDQQKKEEKIIRRRKPDSSGVYVKGSIQGINLTFTADTGATRTIISDRIYNKIDPKKRPELRKQLD